MKTLLLALGYCILTITLTSCATGIVPLGRDTYMVARKGSSWSTGAELRAKCMRDADAFCRQRGLVMVPVSSAGNNGGPGLMGSGEFVFRAVSANDPEAESRPSVDLTPDRVIEIRHRKTNPNVQTK